MFEWVISPFELACALTMGSGYIKGKERERSEEDRVREKRKWMSEGNKVVEHRCALEREREEGWDYGFSLHPLERPMLPWELHTY